MPRLRLVIAYDGSSFRGFAPNIGVPTVAGRLVAAVEQITGATVSLTCAGRTDAGVHAWGQVVHLDLDLGGRTPHSLRGSLNALCGPEVVIRELSVVAPEFDARRDAVARVYRYSILNARFARPLLRHSTWHIPRPLDVEAMTQAAHLVRGTHDFSSFCRRVHYSTPGHDRLVASRVRRVLATDWKPAPNDVLCFQITATSFCRQMVRALTGTLVDIGLGKRLSDSILEIMAARDRNAAGQVAPPQGLALHEVQYP